MGAGRWRRDGGRRGSASSAATPWSAGPPWSLPRRSSAGDRGGRRSGGGRRRPSSAARPSSSARPSWSAAAVVVVVSDGSVPGRCSTTATPPSVDRRRRLRRRRFGRRRVGGVGRRAGAQHEVVPGARDRERRRAERRRERGEQGGIVRRTATAQLDVAHRDVGLDRCVDRHPATHGVVEAVRLPAQIGGDVLALVLTVDRGGGPLGPHAVAEVDRAPGVLERRRRRRVDPRVEHPRALETVERRWALRDRWDLGGRLRCRVGAGEGDRRAPCGRQLGRCRVTRDGHRQLGEERLRTFGCPARDAGQAARHLIGVPADRAVLERRPWPRRRSAPPGRWRRACPGRACRSPTRRRWTRRGSRHRARSAHR